MLDVLTNLENGASPVPVLTKAKQEEMRRMKVWLDEQIAQGKKESFPIKVTITPVLARLLLELNTNNRTISQRNLDTLHSDIAGGHWEYNGASITVSRTAVLVDGQHRLLEVIAANRSIVSNMTFGVPDSARFTTDVCKPKTGANFLGMKDVPYSKEVASAIAFYLQWKEIQSIGTAKTWRGQRPTPTQVAKAIDDHPGFLECAEFTHACKKTVRSHHVLIFCHYALRKRYGHDPADHFMELLITGEGLRRGDPIYYCRERLLNMNGRNDAHSKAELIFKCWNAHRQGEKIAHLRLGSSPKLPKLVK